MKQSGKTVKIIELPADSLFRPDKTLLSNLKETDYLGKSKVSNHLLDWLQLINLTVYVLSLIQCTC